MNCFDCAAVGRSAPAIAVCVNCGAAICQHHAHLTPRWLTYTAAINRTVRVEPPSRSIRCNACQTSHDAAHATNASPGYR